jgi:DNA-binding transcriptional LysR family regulator
MTDNQWADLDLKLVRCFTVVAEHRHFGRAAAVLHVTQPSLSRQISRLERELGARLLDRTPQGTRLTEAGEVFLPLAEDILRTTARAAAGARAAAEPDRITIGYILNVIVTPAVRELRHRYPDADIRTTHLPWDQAHTALLDHRADVAVVRLPFPSDRLHVTVLYDEPRALLVPAGHRLAGKESVTLDDIADEPMPRAPAHPDWDSFWRVDPRPDGRPAPGGPLLETIEDKFELVASGQAVVIIPVSGTFIGNRPDLALVPLEGVAPSQVALATRAGDRRRLVTAFRTIAQSHLTGHSKENGE